MVVAIINVVYCREAGRAYWLGFSLCGGIYLTVCSVPTLRDSVCTRLVTETILDFLYPLLSPTSTPPPTFTPGWTSNNDISSPPYNAGSTPGTLPLVPTVAVTQPLPPPSRGPTGLSLTA